jgi:hypothetical protein
MLCCVVSSVTTDVMRLAFIESLDTQTVTVPTPDETYNVSLTPSWSVLLLTPAYQAMAPDLRRKVDENRRARLALEEGMKQQQNAQVGFTLQPVSYHTFVL